MNINRDYLIINDVKKSSITLNNGSMFFYITDKNTQNIFVNLVINVSNNDLIQKYANIENAEDYTLTMNIVKPDNDCKIIEGKLHDKEKAIFEFDLKEDCVDKIGTYKCELLTKCNINGHEEITTSNSLTYKVNSSILNDLDDIVEAPEYPLVIQLFDKLSDIEQYEEDRRTAELARQLAEEQRQTRFDTLDADMTDSIQAMDNKVIDVENRVSAKEQAVDKLITDTKADINEYKVAKDQEIDDYKTAKDTEINNAITNQDNKIDTAINAQNNRLDAIEVKNQQQDDRLLDIEKVNKRQDIDLKCLFTEAKNNMIDITEEGNSIYLQNSNEGHVFLDEIKGNTLVNCNKEPDKELILNGNINTSGDNAVTLTKGVDGGLVDVALEGNTLVNVSKTKDITAISKAYTVENSGNHIALQGDADGSCRPVITGNTLWIDNATEEVLTAFDETKNLRLQSSFEDNLVTQEMVDSGEEVVDNLGKYRVDYKSTQEDGTVGSTKTLYLNSPLLEGDTIEEKDNGIYHVHRSELVAYTEGDEASLITDKVNTLHQLASPQYELIEQSNLTIPSYTNGHLDFNTAVPVEKVDFKPFSEELTYLYANTQYTVQFISTKAITADITLGGTQLLAQSIVVGLNRISITTPATLVDNKLIIDGVGANISEVVVTNTDRKFGYFEGMKSVGECEELEVKSSNKNLIDPSKVVRGKRIDSQTGEVVGDSSYYALVDYVPIQPNMPLIYSVTKVGTEISPINGTLFHFYDINKKHIYSCWILSTGKLPDSVINGKTPSNAYYLRISYGINDGWGTSYESLLTGQLEEGSTATDYIPHQSNTQQLTHEPLRAVGDARDRYVLIDGKWYIERNCGEVTLDGSEQWTKHSLNVPKCVRFQTQIINAYCNNNAIYSICDKFKVVVNMGWKLDEEKLEMDYLKNLGITISKDKLSTQDENGFKQWLQNNPTKVVYQLETPIYEPFEIEPVLSTYNNVTHISNNSTIPCNMTIKNTGFNCLLKPSTTYTISSNLGLNTVTTPAKLTEDCLRFMDTDTSDVTTMKDVLVLKGDWTTKSDLIPANFSGIESAFEQEYDAEKGKYKVNVKVANEDKSKENNITFYINEPLRGVGNVKDRVFIKDDKVVVQRNCGSVTFDGSDDEVLLRRNMANEIHTIGFGAPNTYTNRVTKCYCNSFAYIFPDRLWNIDGEGFNFNDFIHFRIHKSKLQTQDVSGFKQWLQQNPITVVYQLEEPFIEEVEYNDVKLFIESFKNSTLFYNSNVPVTSKLYYSYSVPIVDTVAQTANVTDQQDSMIIDLATQVAVMEMMLM